MSRRSSVLRRLVAGTAALAVVVVTSLTTTGTAAAAEPGGPGRQVVDGDPLTVAAVSPWVDADGVFQVRFAPDARVAADDTLSWTIHQRLRGDEEGDLRDEVDRVLEGGRPGPVLRPPASARVDALGDPAQGLVLDVPVRSGRDGSDRALLPTPGIHPVTLTLTDAAGDEQWSEVVFLNRLPADPVVGADDRPGVVSVSLVLPVDAGPTVAPDGSVDIDTEERAAVAAAARLLSEVPDAPVDLAVRPNLLDGLVRSGEATDERALDVFRSAARVRRAPQTYVPVDTAGLVEAGGAAELAGEIAQGRRVDTEVLGDLPTSGTWWSEDTVSPAVLPELRAAGADRLVLAPDRLRAPAGVPPSTLTTRTARLQDSGLTAIGTDGELTLRLVDTSRSPGLRAHEVLTELMASWFDAAEAARRSFPGPAAAFVVPPQTEPAALRALLAALDPGGPLTSSAEAVPERPAEVGGRELVATLAPRTPPDETRALVAHRETSRVLSAYRGMVGDADPALGLWGVLASESLSSRSDAGARAMLNQAVRDGVNSRVAAIEAPPPRRVVLTSREATIPLRFGNGLEVPVRLLLQVRSPRLDVQGPERRVVDLEPGENRIDLPVVVRAPGQTLLQIQVTSPDGVLTIPSSPVPVASSTISGVGAALSVLSLLFLAAWWLRTHRRDRRDRARGDHPAVAPDVPALPAGPAPTAATGPGSETADDTSGPVERPPLDRPTAEVPAVEADRRG